MSKRAEQLPTCASGIISLESKEGSLYKRSLICRTGSFKGMFGPVEVTAERLERMALKYNTIRAKPANAHDLAPILIDHIRTVEGVKGRLMAPLSVEDWVDPETGVKERGLYGDLRVDRDQEKVDSGQYSQLSITFDEETDEILEISFVAVEAARRSQVLERGQGEHTMDLQVKLEQAMNRSKSLQAVLANSREMRKHIALALGDNLKAAETDLASLSQSLVDSVSGIKKAVLAAQFRGFIKAGKLSKAEFDKLDLVKLSRMDADGLKVVLSSYESRPAVVVPGQLGQAGAKPVDTKTASTADMRRMIELQKSGKGVGSLADGDGKDTAKADGEKKVDTKSAGEGDKGGKSDEPAVEFKDMDDAMKKLSEVTEAVSKVAGYLKKMGEGMGKMSEQDKKDEDAEKDAK